MKIYKLDWDTNHFGVKVGSVNQNSLDVSSFNKIKEEAKAQDYDVVYVFSNQYDDEIGKPVNTKILYQTALENLPVDRTDQIKILDDSYADQVYDLSMVAGENSRFKLDTNFRVQDFESLYRKWIEKSYEDYHTVFGYLDEEGELLGMISLKLIPIQSVANIELVGVSPKAQGKGIGTKLITACVDFIKENSNIQYFSVYTQEENIKGCRFYEKCGFQKQNHIHIHHIWTK
jgi:ribosomal protein S18 acetylase RimI-like enzyme